MAVSSIQLGQVWRNDADGQDYLVTKVYSEVFTQYAMLRPAGITAVSYTHLDVYKRQPTESDVGPISSVGSSHNRPCFSGGQRRDFWPCPAIGLLDGDNLRTNGVGVMTTTVSYTHLDVYKRQRMCYPKFRKQGLFVGWGVIGAGCKTQLSA